MAIGTPSNLWTSNSSNGSNSLTTSASINASVGDLLIATYGDDGSQAVATAFSDSAGNTWSAVGTGIRGGTGDAGMVRMFSCVVTTALVNGTITGTAGSSSGTWDRYIEIIKVTGSWDSSRVDKTTTNSGTTGNFSVGPTGTTTVANELVVVGCTHHLGNSSTATSSAPSDGCTEAYDEDTGSFTHGILQWRIVSSTGTQSGSGTFTGVTTTAWVAEIATFKEAGAAATSDPGPTLYREMAHILGR